MTRKNKIKTISQAAEKFRFSVKKEDWIKNFGGKKISDNLSKNIDFITENYPYNLNETTICETLIFPILQEVWKDYHESLAIWSHKTIRYNDTFIAVPNYLIAKQSPLGKIVFGLPLLMAVIEAKKDDFDWGWGQCTSEMYAIQENNKTPTLPIYGIVSNGDYWEFGKLENNIVTINNMKYTRFQLDTLFSVIHYIFELCNQNALKIKNN